MTEQIIIQKELNRAFLECKHRNPSFSLRALARRIGISPGSASRILNGKRNVSHKMAVSILERLHYTPEKIDEISQLFQKNTSSESDYEERKQLSLDQFHVISEWYHFAIRQVLKIDGFKGTLENISKRLGITITDTEKALSRLERLGLVKIDSSGLFKSTDANLATSDGVADVSIRRNHAEHLELARNSLDEDDVSVRDFTNYTMAVNSDMLPEARKLIREFREKLSDLITVGKKDKVYNLAIQLFPLSKDEEPHGKEC